MRSTILRTVITATALVMLAAATAARAQAPNAGRTQQTAPPAHEILATAIERANAEHKNVLVAFGASWCVWCLHFDAMLDSDEVGRLFDENYVVAHLTVQESDDKKALENPGAQAMLDAAGAAEAGVPAYIFYDGRGNRLATSLAMPGGGNIGHPVTREEIEAFAGLLAETAPRMTPAERATVVAYLSAQQY